MAAIGQWMGNTPAWILGLLIFAAMVLAALTGSLARRRREKIRKREGKEDADGQEGYVVSAVLGLLALLMGFTFALAVDRYETRRALVLQEANAIGTSYLRAQLLDEPHRSRMSTILRQYTENRVELGMTSVARRPDLLATNDRLLTDLWSATAASFDSVKSLDFSSSLLETVNEVIDLDASRKAARQVRVPPEVFVVLLIYIVVTACVLGYVLVAWRGAVAAGFLFILMVMCLLLIMDIDRPTQGGITESQGPMIALRDTLRAQPPGTFDRWR